jgi:hypothetical protein
MAADEPDVTRAVLLAPIVPRGVWRRTIPVIRCIDVGDLRRHVRDANGVLSRHRSSTESLGRSAMRPPPHAALNTTSRRKTAY